MPAGDPGRQIASLREALRLVRALHGAASDSNDALLDEVARVSAAYERAAPVVRRRFDALAGEMAVWAASGIEALLAAEPARRAAPARCLAEALEDGLARLGRMLPIA